MKITKTDHGLSNQPAKVRPKVTIQTTGNATTMMTIQILMLKSNSGPEVSSITATILTQSGAKETTASKNTNLTMSLSI